MTAVSDAELLSPRGSPAPLVRGFGWASLFVLVAFLINNVLIVWYDFPTLMDAFRSGDAARWIMAGTYVAALVLAIGWVARTPARALRFDAHFISDLNAYLIRGFFFAVLFVGVADFSVAFLRVENQLSLLFPDFVSEGLNRANWTAVYLHVPLIILGFVVAIFLRSLGFMWLALLIVMAELLIVISRFVFSYEQAFMADLVRYWYAALFLFSSAYTLLEDGHVRVDVLYAGFGTRTRGKVNAIGAILLGMATCWVILLVALSGKQSIVNSPVANFEVSQSGSAGMFIKYQMAAFLAVFAVTMLIQFVSYLFEAVADMRDEPGKRQTEAVSH